MRVIILNIFLCGMHPVVYNSLKEYDLRQSTQ
jgi:hypothetical protein